MNQNVRSYNENVVSERSFLGKVYLWMSLGLLITAMVALFVVSSPMLMYRIATSQGLFMGLILGELALVWYMSARVHKMSIGELSLGMIIYAALNGITLSLIFVIYTEASIASTFFVTAGTFALMSFYGYVTKRDLTSMGSFLMMGLMGLILASVVNMFLGNEMIYWVISFVGVLIFTGLTAYDTQKLRKIASVGVDTEEGQKLAMMGALSLYLDFINLFLYLLRLLGRRK